MSVSAVERTLQWVFGDEGDVVTEPPMQLVMVATATSVAGVFVVTPIVSSLAGPFGVSEASIGQLITAFTAPSILLTPVMGVLADRVGRKPVLFAGLVLFGLAGAAVAFTTSFTVALGLRIVQGIGYAATMPIGVAVLGDLYADSRETTAQGLRVAGIQVMVLISPPLAGALAVGSWRYPFFLFLLALGVAVWSWRALPSLTGENTETRSLRAYGADFAALVRRPVMAVVLFTFALRFFLTFAFFGYISVLLTREFGSSALVVGLLVSTYGLISLVAATQAGRVNASGDGLLILLVGFVCGGAGMVAIGLAPSLPTAVAGVVLLSFGTGVISPIQKSLVTQRSPLSLRAGAVSAALLLQSVGQTAGPFFVGVAGGRVSVATAFTVAGVLGIVLGVVSLVPAYRYG